LTINTVLRERTAGEIDLANEDKLWNAVLSRDYRYYSSFVYGVTSSEICCRPTCPSRRPSRERVVFYSDVKLAKEAGYRACLRCKPDSVGAVPQNFLNVKRACNYIEENYDSKITLKGLAQIANQSQFHFHRNFKEIMGITPKEYLEAVRLRHAKFSLKKGESTRKSTYGAGHNSSAWLYSEKDSKFGMSPSKYKSGGEGLVIKYSVSSCPLGQLLVAGTERGVCFVCLGDSREKLVSHLQGEYPKARISPEEGLKPWVSEILGYMNGKNRLENSNLPIDVQATAFQWRVWKELLSIPYGTTMSYNEVAERIGNPLAYRAVANACGSNRVPLVIPCHRVIRKNGDLGGYRWGIERKKKLLKMEDDAVSSKNE